MAKNVVIVESPAKAKTIEKILGSDFEVISSYGHIRDLEKGNNAIDVDNDFIPKYIVPDEKKDVVKKLKKSVKGAEQVWLATDEDREGEAISWHLCEVLDLDVDQTKRIVFSEITAPAIKKAVSNPRKVNVDLVNAQQARRVLDRLVGFELSPVLWRKISRSQSLSAGRVQSVAVRLIVEREREIEKFEVVPHFKITANFIVKDKNGRNAILKAELPKKFSTEGDAQSFLQSCINADYSISDIQVKPASRKPAPPFTTSTLQQEAGRKLGFSVSRTMSNAQKLYEAGKITYMRTDSVNLSQTALENAKAAITNMYGSDYSETRQYSNKNKDAQEAHEAIRPTYFDNTDAGNDRDQERLYELIWKRSIASQMANAKLERTTCQITISTNDEQLVAKGEVVKFDGFLKVYTESRDDDDEPQEDSKMLPPLSIGQLLELREMTGVERFNRPPSRFTEPTLVKKLEELGIGRPSTYAPTINTVQRRNYVVKESREGKVREYQVHTLRNNNVTSHKDSEVTGTEKNKLFPTDMGIVVTDFLVKHFGDILNYDFTAKIEAQFDHIAKGGQRWNDMIDHFYHPFHKTIETTLETAEKATGARPLGEDPKTGKPVIARLGKYGPMVQIGEAGGEEKPRFAKIPPGQSIQSITFEAAMKLFDLPRILGEYEGKPLKANDGRFGPYVQWGSTFASIKKDAPFTLFNINYEQAVELMQAKLKADAEKIIKVFMEDETLSIQNGRWGPYIKHGKNNIKIPKEHKETDPKTFSFEQVMEFVKNAPAKKGRKAPAKKKAAPKKK